MDKIHGYLGHVFFSGRETLCIAVKLDEVGKMKAYIARIVGDDPEFDVKHVLEWGTKFPAKNACDLVLTHGTCKDKNARQLMQDKVDECSR